ncbi:CWF19-like protein [Escovopsis weberi]|uniref:CWF19-like protein n=1 Tax=Escovopsis weberi TaxID=150374 RepID=A0A0M8MPF7_ESCWE|nr:CWF19-like protein [Escovopsis weberi]
MAALKIIVLGSLNGQLEPALKKVAALHAKNNFSLAILTGQVFSSPAAAAAAGEDRDNKDDQDSDNNNNNDDDDKTITALLDGSLQIPLPTYFTVGTDPLPPRIAAKIAADEELCPNLHYLGKRSVTKTSDGLRIVALGGALDPNLVAGVSKEQHLPFHSADDARSLKGANNADILLTAAWPAGVWNRSAIALDPAHRAAAAASDDIADLCATLRPRYHLSASPGAFFYEREPFVFPAPEDGSASTAVTRFISMAPFGNEAKAKAMYAFSLNKSDTAVPPGATPSPFVARHNHHHQNSKRSRNDDGGGGGGGVGFSRYGTHQQQQHHHHDRRNKRRRGGPGAPPPGPDRCYFCLSNPNLSSHMCCSIGDDAYVTTAKGPLLTSSTFADRGLDFPGHFIIIPLPHAPTIAGMGGDPADPASDAARTLREMQRFRESLQAMIAARSAHRLGAVTWEISRARNVHLIWQLVAVPADLVASGVVEAAFRVEAQNLEYPPLAARDDLAPDQLPNTTTTTTTGEEDGSGGGGGDYFRVWIWADDGEKRVGGSCLVMPLPADARFDLQFGRRVLAKLMGLDDRFSWQACEQSTEEETKDVETFRKAFQDWDFTLA